MSSVGYLWRDSDDWIAVRPPDSNASIWREWLMRQDASQRRYISTTNGGYWLISPHLVNNVQERFIIAGWVLEFKNPYSGVTGNMDDSKSSFKNPIHRIPIQPSVVAYQLLFIQPNAPRCVIDASYRALMKEVHSDINDKGEDSSKLINNARDIIYKERGW